MTMEKQDPAFFSASDAYNAPKLHSSIVWSRPTWGKKIPMQLILSPLHSPWNYKSTRTFLFIFGAWTRLHCCFAIYTLTPPYFLQTSRRNPLFWTFLPYGFLCTPVRDCRQFHDKTPYGTCSNKSSPVRALQTNHFLNTKKQSSSFKKKILLTKSSMLFQMRKSAQTITLMQRT